MDSLQFLVVNTENKQPEMIEFNIRAYEYDFMVLIPSITIGVDERYIKLEEVGGSYTLYINQHSMNTSLTLVSGNNVCGAFLQQFGVVFLLVDPEVPESFVNHLDILYPNKTLFVVNKEIPDVVFDVYTRDTDHNFSRININNSAYRAGFMKD